MDADNSQMALLAAAAAATVMTGGAAAPALAGAAGAGTAAAGTGAALGAGAAGAGAAAGTGAALGAGAGAAGAGLGAGAAGAGSGALGLGTLGATEAGAMGAGTAGSFIPTIGAEAVAPMATEFAGMGASAGEAANLAQASQMAAEPTMFEQAQSLMTENPYTKFKDSMYDKGAEGINSLFDTNVTGKDLDTAQSLMGGGQQQPQQELQMDPTPAPYGMPQLQNLQQAPMPQANMWRPVELDQLQPLNEQYGMR